MRDKKEEITLTRVKQRSSWQVSQDSSGEDGAVNQYTMFVIGATAFFAGFWGLACLANAFFHVGPLSLLGQLTAAITGL